MYDYMVIYCYNTYGNNQQFTGQLFIERESEISTRKDIHDLEHMIKQLGEYNHVIVINYKLINNESSVSSLLTYF